MSDAEKLMNKKLIYKAEMDRLLPKERSDELWRQATERLEGILDQHPDIPKGVRVHVNKIFPATAVYLTLKEAVGEEKAYAALEDAAVTLCAGYSEKLRNLMKLPGMSGLFVRLWDPLVKKIFGPDNGFENVFYPRKKGEYRMDVVSCPYCRYFTELGCPELTRVFCENDDRMYGNLPGLEFRRTGTLGKGAERCDFLMKKV